MGAGVTTTGDRTAQTDGAGAGVLGALGEGAIASSAGANRHSVNESPRQSLGLRVTEDRVLIRADREDHAPAQTASGLYTASSLAAAVEGTDEAQSWFVGTIVQLGPLVNRMEHQPVFLRWLFELEDNGHDLSLPELRALRHRVEALPVEMPDPLKVGDRVMFSWAVGQEIAVDGDKYLILHASEVLAVLEAE